MGSGTKTQGSEFQAAKHRINSSLEHLRDELRAIHEQDLSLLRQLMQIHHTITLLTGAKNKRSYSSGCLSSPSPVPEEQVSLEPRRMHPALSRGHSLPFRTEEPQEDGDDDDEDDESEDEEEADDRLSLSCTSNCSDPLGHSTEDPSYGDYAMFYPLPFNLQHPPLFPSQSLDIEDDDVDVDDVTSCQVSCADDTANETPELVQHVTDADSHESIRRFSERKPLSNYELSYSAFLKRSSQVWREVQREQEETGTVDEKKRATLSVFL